MRTIKASEFKAKCLKLMDEVAASGEPLVVTKNGKPVVQLGPVTRERKSLWGHKGQIEILGDISRTDRRRVGCKPLILLDTHCLIWLDRRSGG